MAETSKNETDSKKNKLIIILIIVLVVVVIGLAVVIAYLLGRGSGNKDNNVADTGKTGREVTSSVRTVVEEDDAEDVMSQMREEVEEGMFECQMTMTWTFNDGKSESKDAYVANSTNNTHPIYFDVYMKDTDELLYSSPVLPVGTELKNIKLDKELAPGEYKATVMYTLIRDVETQEEISSAGFVITIKIQN